MKLKILFFTLFLSLSCINICYAANDDKKETSNVDSYLSKPTGKYSVGFKDFYWINQNICPDFNYNRKNKNDFISSNKKHCHEIVTRIYYPVSASSKLGGHYYPPFIKNEQTQLSEIPRITSEQIQQLNTVRSYSIRNATIASGKKFPVLIFIPGFGCPVELYENFITELVSQGYIVVGVSTPFINLVELQNGHVVKAAIITRNEADEKFVPMQMRDLSYVFKEIHFLHNKSTLFSAMDLEHIGVFGHSVGGRSVENVVQIHPNWFQAATTLDVAFYKNEPIKKSVIPFMHIISAYWKLYFSWPLVFELGNSQYLVVLSPSEKNQHYSYHMNFSDYSTLQYLPVYKMLLASDEKKHRVGKDIKVMSHEPTTQEFKNFNKSTYVFIKNKNTWNGFYYESGKKITNIDIDSVAGLRKVLVKLPNKPPEQFTISDIVSIEKIIMPYYLGYGNFLGTGNGWQITDSVNTYLVQFFNTFLKNKKNPAFKNCTALSSDTMLKCGPGIFGDVK